MFDIFIDWEIIADAMEEVEKDLANERGDEYFTPDDLAIDNLMGSVWL